MLMEATENFREGENVIQGEKQNLPGNCKGNG